MTELRNEVLDKLDRSDLAVYIGWEPMAGGTAEAAAAAAGRVVDRRVTQYWDAAGAIGRAFGEALEIPGVQGERYGFGWDLYMLFEPGVAWREPAPVPSYWMHGLMVVSPSRAPVFNGPALRERIAQIAVPSRD